jgi:hypothetical protein
VSTLGEVKDARRVRVRGLQSWAEGGRPGIFPRRWRALSVALSMVLLVFGLGLAASPSRSAPTVPAVSASVPQLVSTYSGTVHNLTVDLTAEFELTGITEDQQGDISGQSVVEPPLYGGGAFTGTVSNTAVIFTSRSRGDILCPAGACTVTFSGTVSQTGTMSGTYVASHTGGSTQTSTQDGTWQLSPQPNPEVFGSSGIVQAPSAKACVSRRSFTIHIRKIDGLDYRQVVVYVAGHRVKVLKGHGISAVVDLRGLPRGTYVVKITVLTTGGTKLTGTRVYHTCRAHPLHPRRKPKL